MCCVVRTCVCAVCVHVTHTVCNSGYLFSWNRVYMILSAEFVCKSLVMECTSVCYMRVCAHTHTVNTHTYAHNADPLPRNAWMCMHASATDPLQLVGYMCKGLLALLLLDWCRVCRQLSHLISICGRPCLWEMGLGYCWVDWDILILTNLAPSSV